MDFYHILPSNTSPNYYPNNNASQYSTPLNKPYDLPGNWEVALMNLTYSTCVNTFNNDQIIVEENVNPLANCADCARNTKGLLKVTLAPPTSTNPTTARQELIQRINLHFKTLLQLSLSNDGKKCTWKITTKEFYFILSPTIVKFFQLWSDVITTMDASYTNFTNFFVNDIPTKESELFIMLASVESEGSVTTVLKRKNEKITAQQLLERFQTVTPTGIINVKLLHGSKFVLEKLHNDRHLIILNKYLRSALTFSRAGMYHSGNQNYVDVELHDKEHEWSITVIKFKDITVYQKNTTKIITLPPVSFGEESEAIRFINEKINDKRITFSCNAAKRITLNITDQMLKITFDDTLRDIFAFDKNTYSGVLTCEASDFFSLDRRIQYLYIYSNITDFVRVGNTETPLLGIVPFLKEKGCSLFKERIFKTPMYIRIIRDHISQIDIAIYDGAGQLVPFVKNSTTTLRLHFRPI